MNPHLTNAKLAALKTLRTFFSFSFRQITGAKLRSLPIAMSASTNGHSNGISSANSIYKPVTHVVFDMDGLLIDSERYYTEAFNTVTQRYGKDFGWETKVKLMGTKARQGAEIVVKELQLPITPEEFLEQVDQEYPNVFTKVALMPGVERFLDHLRAHKIPCCIASSSKRITFEMKTNKFGEKFEPGYYFHHIVLATDDPEVKRSKPFPDTFLVAASRFDDKPTVSECLVFEDSVLGVLAGCRANMQVVMIPDHRLDIEAVRKVEPEFKPTLILSSMLDLKPEQFGLPPFPTVA